MKLDKKHLRHLLYATLIALPLFSIAGRVIYTQANKNAKDSYYGETINVETSTRPTDLKLNSYYLFSYSPTDQTQIGSNYLYVNGIQNLQLSSSNSLVDHTDEIIVIDIHNYNSSTQNISVIWFYDANNTRYTYDLNNTNNISFNFTLINYTDNYTQELLDRLQIIEYNKYSYLDNAFEYSIARFTEDNNFGKLDFFTFFSSIFLNSNTINNLYIGFINWYMNYILYVSLAYLLFGVLMWFVSFFRKLVEDSQNLDIGV